MLPLELNVFWIISDSSSWHAFSGFTMWTTSAILWSCIDHAGKLSLISRRASSNNPFFSSTILLTFKFHRRWCGSFLDIQTFAISHRISWNRWAYLGDTRVILITRRQILCWFDPDSICWFNHTFHQQQRQRRRLHRLVVQLPGLSMSLSKRQWNWR